MIMKQIKFTDTLVPLVLNGSKTSTWRLFDDKNLQTGDELEFLNKETGQVFGYAEIIGVKEKPLGEITEVDFDGHDTYKGRDEMLAAYRGYYSDRVDWNTMVKMIDFKLIPKP